MDRKALTAALAELDKTKVPAIGDVKSERSRQACLTRGTTERCARVYDADGDTAEMKAFIKVRDALAAAGAM